MLIRVVGLLQRAGFSFLLFCGLETICATYYDYAVDQPGVEGGVAAAVGGAAVDGVTGDGG